MRKMKKKIPIILIILVIILGTIFLISKNNAKKYDYKKEKIMQYNYYIYQENEKYGIIDALRKRNYSCKL